MNSSRPRMNIPKSRTEIMLRIFCAVAAAGITVYTIFFYSRLPEVIPTHFDALGNIDGYGSKATVFLLLPVIFLFFAMFGSLGRHPYLYNYITEITEENAYRQYKLVRKLISILGLEVILIFCYIQYTILQSAYGKMGLGVWFLPVSIISVLGTIIGYAVASYKIK